jgi:hypothetical protein
MMREPSNLWSAAPFNPTEFKPAVEFKPSAEFKPTPPVEDNPFAVVNNSKLNLQSHAFVFTPSAPEF